MSNIKVAIVQSDIRWENKKQNLRTFSEKLNSLTESVDLIVLPEMFTTGFTMNSEEMAESMQGESVKWMAEIAEQKNCVLAGGIIVSENNKIFNRFIWMRPDGSFEHYDKKHLFRLANEQDYFDPGDKRLVVELKGWRFCLQTCYDLRFPVWSRNKGDFDALIYIASWPERRRDAWSTLLLARAMENQVYTIGVNRVGIDGKEIVYSGDSVVVHPMGHLISKTKPYEESVELVALSMKELEDFRKDYPLALDADDFVLS